MGAAVGGVARGYPAGYLAGGDRRALLKDVTPRIDAATLLAWQAHVDRVYASPALLDYVQALLAATRSSPRASRMP